MVSGVSFFCFFLFFLGLYADSGEAEAVLCDLPNSGESEDRIRAQGV